MAMAEIQESKKLPGIKLFGATISMKTQTKTESDEEEAEKSDQSPEKRPEKIIPCPRCQSMETKFCYFNNYNVNQPRHYCRGCQRYWTAGGALRNVPVGAGRRKNKPPCRDLTELSHGCLLEGSDAHQLDFAAAAEHSGFGRVFPAKRRRWAAPNGQPC